MSCRVGGLKKNFVKYRIW